MNLKQAHKILGTSTSASMDEVKSAYKKLAFEFHPDRNKDSKAAEKLKEVNEAYETIKNPPKSSFQRSGFVDGGFDIDLGELFSNFGFGGFKKKPARQVLPVQINLNITFVQAITGFEHILTFTRQIKCEDCQGMGQMQKGNGCDQCGGTGQFTQQSGNMMFSSTCPKCRGKMPKPETCQTCQTKTYLEKEFSATVKIPSGMQDQDTLRLQGLGHFVVANGTFGDQYGDVLLHLTVEKHPTLSYQAPDVICPITISLLEALEGIEKTVPTIRGDQTISIPPNSRHKEEIRLKDLGVKEQNGVQRIILDVEYPNEKKEKLLELLRN